MPNTIKLKKRMSELGITQSALASKLSLATPTICQKINNIRPFTLGEAEKVAEILQIKDTEFGDYFFTL